MVFIIPGPDVGQETCGAMFFSFMVTHSSFVLWRFGEWFKIVNKLISDHINLTSYSVIRVTLAAQVISETVGDVSNIFGPDEAEETDQFCIMMDKYFDCLNVRNIRQHIIKRKSFLKPYESVDDVRFVLNHEMLLIIQKKLNLKCLSHGKIMRVYKLLFYPSKKSVNFSYNKVFLIFIQKDFVRMILKIIS